MCFYLVVRKISASGAALRRRTLLPSHPRRGPFRGLAGIAALLSLVLLIGGGAPAAQEKIMVGAVENVLLLPWGLSLPARIDTGAATSSLDARNITVKGKTVEFHLPGAYGGHKARLPIERWSSIKTAALQERRPVVSVEMCIGSRRVRTQVNLNDRSQVTYPLLIGRNTLEQGFIVDPGVSFLAPPSCPEVAPP